MNKNLKIGDVIKIESYLITHSTHNFLPHEYKIDCPICKSKNSKINSHKKINEEIVFQCSKCNSKFKFVGLNNYDFSAQYKVLKINNK